MTPASGGGAPPPRHSPAQAESGGSRRRPAAAKKSGRGTGRGGAAKPEVDELDPSPSAGCPACGARRTARGKFCEECGYDLTTTGGAEAPSKPADRPPRPRAKMSWEAVVEASRPFYLFYRAAHPDLYKGGEYEFPGSYPPRVIAISGQRLAIGRSSTSRQIHPDIDLRDEPEDQFVSHEHAVLELQVDGSYALVDQSRNGTFINSERKPTKPGVAVPLQDGDRIYIGAWTRILFRASS